MLFQLASLLTAILGMITASATKPSDLAHQNTGCCAAARTSLSVARPPQNTITQSLPSPTFSAQSAFLIDTTTGNILLEKNADAVRPIASITKLMTALTIIDAKSDWSKPITLEAKDQRDGGIDYLIPGETIMPADAWRLMLVGSSNDAAALLARVVGNTECFNAQHLVLCDPEQKFVQEMNKKAKQLGLVRTTFTDPTGLDSKNISTARETAALARTALAIPKIRDTVQTRKFLFTPQGKNPRLINSTNWLLGSFSSPNIQIFGGKTGHIEESGYNLVFSAGNKKHELMGVVLGSKSNETRFSEMSRLLQWGFNIVQ